MKKLMISKVRFENFRVLKRCEISLRPLTVVIGANGTGKSTIFKALEQLSAHANKNPPYLGYDAIASIDVAGSHSSNVEVVIDWAKPFDGIQSKLTWQASKPTSPAVLTSEYAVRTLQQNKSLQNKKLDVEILKRIAGILANIKVMKFDPNKIANPTLLRTTNELSKEGQFLGAVLHQLQNRSPENFEMLLAELRRWLPEYDHISFDVPQDGQVTVLLRLKSNKKTINAQNLSDGTLYCLALLTIAYLDNPPSVICIEEPDHGVHPRLLRLIRDSLYRLSYPQEYGVEREPVQVIATTHSPLFIDQFRDHPEEIVIAEKKDNNVIFQSLADRNDIDDIISNLGLGEAWYTGVLGGVPAEV